MSGVLASEYVKGLQGNNDRYFQAIGIVKSWQQGRQYICYSITSSQSLLEEGVINTAVSRLFMARMRLEEFDKQLAINAAIQTLHLYY